MSQLKFYIEKVKFLAAFLRMREWRLVRDEWRITYCEYLEAHENIEEIIEEAVKRIMKELPNEESTDHSEKEAEET